ncbi:uncharacterized protein CTRU02_200399 [Colletotrichum truncatum]|uniref:Uncharacterized protein n=1 Tax=Colletotrichum truncatum TaxID=5467 RepID=A0ACC3ZF45_COLTU|nr:uncharacterized protein CTRU02_00158 [Colletotrichum truncatum]KAF6801409.1 hypothetical protein CTRU02_00158 [Colletotrichum truncatum]
MTDLSIQAFYEREVATLSSTEPPSIRQPQDNGFTQAEIEARTNPLGRSWAPSVEYQELDIAHIQPGPALIRFTGRIINYAPSFLDSKNIYSRPAHLLIVKDDTGAVAVKLMPIGIPASCILIGQLVTVWASWAGTEATSNQGSIPFVMMHTPINPADVGTKQFIQFVSETPATQSLCRTPMECEPNKLNSSPLPGLMTLGQYLKTGHDTCGARILVSIKSIGARKHILTHDRTRETELLEVNEDKANSAKLWSPNETVLLLTNPKFVAPRENRSTQSPAGIGLNYNTLIDVDPNFPDSHWLRQWAKTRARKERIHFPFPEDVWNVDEAIHGHTRALFTLAEVDDFARTDPATEFTGKLNLTVLGVSLLDLHRRRMLCCTECCGVPLYSNQPSAVCQKCMKVKPLAPNPRIMGILADETGCIGQGKLVWGEQAWGDLFFFTTVDRAVPISGLKEVEDQATHSNTSVLPSWAAILSMGADGLRTLEEQMLYSRLTLTFG